MIIGLDRAGKSVIMNYLATGILVKEIKPTLNIDYGSIILYNIKCPFYDTPGQKSLRSTWTKVLNLASFVIYTIDAADVARYLESMNELLGVLKNPHLQNIPLIILFHKMDLPAARAHLEELKTYFSQDFIDSYGVRDVAYFETTIDDLSSLDAVKFYLQDHISKLTGILSDVSA